MISPIPLQIRHKTEFRCERKIKRYASLTEGWPVAAQFNLASVLEKLSIPCRLEVGTEGGHGFADGSGMCMAGWPERAIRWYESLQQLCVG